MIYLALANPAKLAIFVRFATAFSRDFDVGSPAGVMLLFEARGRRFDGWWAQPTLRRWTGGTPVLREPDSALESLNERNG